MKRVLHALRRAASPFVLGGALFVMLMTWAIGVPRFGAPDEPAHVYKAFGVSHGELLGEPAEGFPGNLREFDVPGSLGAGDLTCFVGKPEVPYSCVVEGTGLLISSAAPYPPYYYGVVGGVVRAFGQNERVVAYRAVSAAMCAAALAVAFTLALRSRGKRLAPLLVVGITPTAWFLMGAVSPNALEIAMFSVIWVLLARSASDDSVSGAFTLGAGLLAGGVVVMRPVAILWLLPVAACALVLTPDDRQRELLTRRHLVRLLAPTGAAVIASMVWLRYARFDMNDERTVVERSFWNTARDTIRLFDNYLRQTAGELGWVDTRLPRLAYVALFGVVVALIVLVIRATGRRGVLAVSVVVGAWLLFPFLINGFTAPTAGLSWQGRYALPFVVGIPCFALFVRHAHPSARWERVMVVGLVVTSLALEVLAFWTLVRRYTVGTDGKIVLLGGLDWSPSVSPMVLVAVNAVAAAAVCALLFRRGETLAPQNWK